MTPTRSIAMPARVALAVAALAAGLLTFGAMSAHAIAGPLSAASARADDHDRGEHRISKHHGAGAHAARVARHRIGGGHVVKVTKSPHDRDRYEVKLRKGDYRYEVDLSRHFRVLEVDRERSGSDDD